jgi:hypothetical protein
LLTKRLNHHSLFFLLLTMIVLFPLVFNAYYLRNPLALALWVAIALSYYILTGMRAKNFTWVVAASLLFHIPLLFSGLFFSGSRQVAFATLLLNYARLVSASTLSLISMQQFHYNQFLYFIMQKRLISPVFGHTLILSFNSIGQITKDWEDIKLIAQSRGLPFYKYHTLVFALLVSSIHHAQRGATSLLSRGIKDDKIYVFDYGIKTSDFLVTMLYLGIFGLFWIWL